MMEDVFKEYVGEVSPETFYKVRYYLLRYFTGYGNAMMHDRGIEDIYCDAPDAPVFVYHRNYRDLETKVEYEEGKTTSMSAVSLFIPEKSKVVSIEDTREITLPHKSWAQGVTRESPTGEEKANIGMSELLQSALRQRSEYLLVGEISTEPKVARTFFQAMATGHTSHTTFHANSVETVLSRVGNQPLNAPPQMLHELNVVAVQKQVLRGGKRVRRNMRMAELGVGREGPDDMGWNDVYR